MYEGKVKSSLPSICETQDKQQLGEIRTGVGVTATLV